MDTNRLFAVCKNCGAYKTIYRYNEVDGWSSTDSFNLLEAFALDHRLHASAEDLETGEYIQFITEWDTRILSIDEQHIHLIPESNAPDL